MRDLRLFNEALLGKRLWGFMNKKGNLWRAVVAIKYSTSNFGCYPTTPNGSYAVSYTHLTLPTNREV